MWQNDGWTERDQWQEDYAWTEFLLWMKWLNIRYKMCPICFGPLDWINEEMTEYGSYFHGDCNIHGTVVTDYDGKQEVYDDSGYGLTEYRRSWYDG